MQMKTANYCGVSFATVKQIGQYSRERNYAELKPYIFDKGHMFPPQRPPALPRSKLFSEVTDSRCSSCSVIAVTKLHASRPQKDFTPLQHCSKSLV
jgi:hypothetical protein